MQVESDLLVIGCGNCLRGDDAVGLRVAERLGRCLKDRATVLVFEGEPIALMSLWLGFERVILIDAARSGVAPGTLYRFEASRSPLPARPFGPSSHAFSLSAVIELARTLEQLPVELTVYGVEGGSFNLGDPLSEPLQNAVPDLTRRILNDLERAPRPERTA